MRVVKKWSYQFRAGVTSLILHALLFFIFTLNFHSKPATHDKKLSATTEFTIVEKNKREFADTSRPPHAGKSTSGKKISVSAHLPRWGELLPPVLTGAQSGDEEFNADAKSGDNAVAPWGAGGIFPLPFVNLDFAWLKEHWETYVEHQDPFKDFHEAQD